MVYVCDAIMGSGKSKSCISFINDNIDKKFIYITPYLPEAERIATSCPELHFVQPSDKLPEYKLSKLEHTRALMREGRNIASTHAAFRSYTDDMIQSIKANDYILLIDEAVDVFREVNYNHSDVQLMVDGGYAEYSDGVYRYTGKEYTGSRLRDMYEMLRCNNLIPVDKGRTGFQYYYWAFPKEILCAFRTVYIMTYLFDASEMKEFIRHYGIEYQYIGIRRDGDTYRFAETMEYVPEYVSRLKEYLHIFYNTKLNQVGKHKMALSSNWFASHEEERAILKNNMYSFLRYYMNAPGRRILWSTFDRYAHWLRGRGYSRQNVAFNIKATNSYRDRDILAYCVNIFPTPQKVKFFASQGMTYDTDGAALSTMIQWIWRSAIRDGHEIWVYIPSRRMRTLLEDWLDRLATGGDM